MPLDGYEQSTNVYVDKFGNQLTYFNWHSGEPSSSGTERYLETMDSRASSRITSDTWNDIYAHKIRNVVCMKCTGHYSIPTNYECHDTDFGTVVVKAFNEAYSPTAARDKCTSDASYLHLPIPISAAQNQWYWKYSQHMALADYWLGINDAAVEGEFRTDKGDLLTYSNWATLQPDDYGPTGQDWAYTGGSPAPDGTWDDISSSETKKLLCTHVV